MAGLNKVMLIGNLGADPEVKFTSNGNAVANLRLAVTTKFKSGDEWKDDTQWITVVVWGKQAENAGEYLSKGRPIFVEGKIKNRSWQDRDGNKRWVTEVLAERIQYLGSSDSGKGSGEQKGDYEKARTPGKGKVEDEFGGEFSGADIDDDIPF